MYLNFSSNITTSKDYPFHNWITNSEIIIFQILMLYSYAICHIMNQNNFHL